jgi:hypothetical protein
MPPFFSPRPAADGPSVAAQLTRLGLLLLPAWLLLLGSVRDPGGRLNFLLWLGAVFQIGFAYLSLRSQRDWSHPAGSPLLTLIVALYLVALGWLWLGMAQHEPGVPSPDWFLHLAQAVLVVVPVIVFAVQTVAASSGVAIRQAYALAQHLSQRQEWPAELGGCRSLPEVKALREALYPNAGPALALLAHSRPQVRVAALAALEFRRHWKRGEAERVLRLAQLAEEPVERAAAVSALGNLGDRVLVELLAEFLRDPSREVRRAAAEALLWDTGRRWGWIRSGVRAALTDPALQQDGPLWHDTLIPSREALRDLTAWTAERGLLANRAAQILGVHYARALSDGPQPAILNDLRRQLADPQTPSVLRLELGRLLLLHQALDRPLLEQLLDPSNPAPLRLHAADALLAEEVHAEALAALRDVARLSNREIALATAQVLQRRLGLDMGLTLSEPLPSVLSRRAAEVMRHVMAWALSSQEGPDDLSSSPVVHL